VFVYITWCQVSDIKWRKCITNIQQKQTQASKKSETMEALRQQIEALKATVNTLQQERSNAGSLNTSIPLPKPINVTEGDIGRKFQVFSKKLGKLPES
jgi:hypothetical protein